MSFNPSWRLNKDFPCRASGNITQRLVASSSTGELDAKTRCQHKHPKDQDEFSGCKIHPQPLWLPSLNAEREKERRRKGGRRSGSGGGLGAHRLLRPHDFPGCFQGTAETRAYEFHVIAYLRKHIRNVVCISHPLGTPPDCGLPGTRCILPIRASGDG